MEQDKSLKYHLEIYESTPFIELMFQATVPISCADCLLTVPIASHVGLTVSNCSITLLPDAYTTLRIRAVPTAGANARIVPLTFGAIEAAGTPWDGLQVHTILVSFKVYFICCSNCLLCSHTCLSVKIFVCSAFVPSNYHVLTLQSSYVTNERRCDILIYVLFTIRDAILTCARKPT